LAESGSQLGVIHSYRFAQEVAHLAVFTSRVTTDQAISRGVRVVNGPVWLILVASAVVFVLAHDQFHLDVDSGRFGIPTLIFFVGCFVSAWLRRSISVPKWRLWAYEHVQDIQELKCRAVAARLIWPDGSFSSRTESAAHAQRERDLENVKLAGCLAIVACTGGGVKVRLRSG
jgi:hypothetical protein